LPMAGSMPGAPRRRRWSASNEEETEDWTEPETTKEAQQVTMDVIEEGGSRTILAADVISLSKKNPAMPLQLHQYAQAQQRKRIIQNFTTHNSSSTYNDSSESNSSLPPSPLLACQTEDVQSMSHKVDGLGMPCNNSCREYDCMDLLPPDVDRRQVRPSGLDRYPSSAKLRSEHASYQESCKSSVIHSESAAAESLTFI